MILIKELIEDFPNILSQMRRCKIKTGKQRNAEETAPKQETKLSSQNGCSLSFKLI